MLSARTASLLVAALLMATNQAAAQSSTQSSDSQTPPTMAQLVERLAAEDARIRELQQEISSLKQQMNTSPTPATTAAPQDNPPPSTSTVDAPKQETSSPTQTAEPPAAEQPQHESMGHDMTIGSGPTINFRGFFDFNFGVGSIANPLVFPIADNGCGNCGNPTTPPHTTFQAGEFDLFLTSKLSDRLSFLSEVVLGPDDTNVFGPDIERYSLTYRLNRYFVASAGRFHTSIGYYNTAYHHGTWFSTAEGRPIMYLFEDSGGVLPVHTVGVNLTGAVPDTEKLGLHWVAEVGNGVSSGRNSGATVQNFYSDRNYKATNLAAYIKPQFLPGLQIGGSWYQDGLNPLSLPGVKQHIESAYVVFLNSTWESLTEGVLLSNRLLGTDQTFRSPMAYTQLARKFGIYKPYFRYQYVRDHPNDPVNILKGTFYGPSVGLRVDFSEFAAIKFQFNHLYDNSQFGNNGFDTQLAFTF
jgi:hypothetical protein